MKRVMIIDALNAYFRAYIVNPSLSTNGQPIGGYKGFLGILQKLAREMNPDAIVIAWDGAGGSARRKLVNKNYKAGRKPIRLNRGVRNMTEDEEMKNKVWQQYRLIEMLNCTPVIQLMLDGTEADDVISYVVQAPRYEGWQKIIVSSDRDFFQLCDDETVLYRPIQKTFVNKPRLVEEYGIHPTNFALARAVAGDKSDNLPGVRGVGLATIAKRMPFFADEKSVTLTELVEYCAHNNTGLKKLEAIADAEELVAENYKIMQLYAPSISLDGKNKIKYIFDNFEPLFNKTEIIKRMNEDGFGNMDLSDLFAIFKRFTTKA